MKATKFNENIYENFLCISYEYYENINYYLACRFNSYVNNWIRSKINIQIYQTYKIMQLITILYRHIFRKILAEKVRQKFNKIFFMSTSKKKRFTRNWSNFAGFIFILCLTRIWIQKPKISGGIDTWLKPTEQIGTN